jgi:hypothetical protein
VNTIRALRLLLATATVLLLLFLPSADVLAFGLHEHLVETPEQTMDVAGSNNMQSQPSVHHCELSVSVGDLVAVASLPAPVTMLVFTLEPPVSVPQHRPFVLIAPPRS